MRTTGSGVSQLVNAVANTTQLFVHPRIVASAGVPALMLIYAFNCALAVMFVSAYLPETRGLTLEEIQAKLMAGTALSYWEPPECETLFI